MNKWISTTPEKTWETMTVNSTERFKDTLEITGEVHQVIDGFGGCFNEMGWATLLKLDEENRAEVLRELFDPEGSCRFNLCRLPLGANDYALEWYSLNEHDGDYRMDRFSIDRDRQYLIPYIKEAMAYQPDLKLFASPWSPPTWMKSPRAHNYGTLIWERENLQAYALYFAKFVRAYRDEGIRINQIHVQNEPMSDQKFPSCIWTGEQFREFIRDYLGPRFEEEGLDTEIWLGTLNGPEVDERFLHTGYDQYANLVLADLEARRYVKGISYQWCGKNAVQQTYLSWPELKLMQSENECGDGRNTWEYARYVFNLCRHYFMNGIGSYIYWNMVLPPGGRSTWGWEQNAMITVDPDTKAVIYNPEYYVMKHFSRFIREGARRLGIRGHWAGSSVVFENPNGELVFIVGNGLPYARGLEIRAKGTEINLELKAYSINTIVV